MLVNGVAHVVAFLPTTGGTPGSSTLTVPLKSGTGNVIEFEAYNSGWGELSLWDILSWRRRTDDL